MLNFDNNGMIQNPRVIPARRLAIERQTLDAIHGIIVHQTGGATAQSALDSYLNAGANGAHLLIDKEGVIYQTASFLRQTWHVGKLKARCLAEKRCSPVDAKALTRFNPTAENRREMEKLVPDRYPANVDAIGIELVGKPDAKGNYELPTSEQNQSLTWVIGEITQTFGISMTEIFRHPDVSRKTPTEAQGARW
jgi:N-acetyl-anhydromuramyl-L-alanine amidase AmpD